jgi:hypothetical protein
MQEIPKSAAQSVYPHLPSAERAPVQSAKPTLAAALYPSLAPKPPQPAPRPARSLEWARDWSGVDLNYARRVGLIRTEGNK